MSNVLASSFIKPVSVISIVRFAGDTPCFSAIDKRMSGNFRLWREYTDAFTDSMRAFPSPFANCPDVRDDRVALVSLSDDAVLHIDDEERGIRPLLECGHGLPLALGSCFHHGRPTH